jgi:hypothetical protein
MLAIIAKLNYVMGPSIKSTRVNEAKASKKDNYHPY